MKKKMLVVPSIGLVLLFVLSRIFDLPALYQYGAIVCALPITLASFCYFSEIEEGVGAHPGMVMGALAVLMVIILPAHGMAYGKGHGGCVFDPKVYGHVHAIKGIVIADNDPKDNGRYVFVDFGKKLGIHCYESWSRKRSLLAGTEVTVPADSDMSINVHDRLATLALLPKF